MARAKGFTLIELMLVVAIIGLLAAIAVPKFANLAIRAKEASIQGKLGSVRSAISIYYADNDGKHPADLNHALLSTLRPMVPKYLDEFPSIQIPTVPSHLRCSFTSATAIVGDDMDAPPPRAWAYNRLNGEVRANCNHTDSKGSTWSFW